MRARLAGSEELDPDVAVAVEAARVTDVGVVVRDGDRVVELRPTHALELDHERLAGLDDLRHRHEAALHVVRDLRLTFPACQTCTTCQPPRPSGTVIGLCSEPSAPAVPPPSGTSTKLQHVPVQLTRLPTTVDQDSVTGAFGVPPVAVSWTRERIAPLVELSCTREPAACREVRPGQGRARVDRRAHDCRPLDPNGRDAGVLRHRELAPMTVSPGNRRLFHVQVWNGVTRARVLDPVRSDVSRGTELERHDTARRVRRQRAREAVVVEHRADALVRRRAHADDLDRDRRPDWPARRADGHLSLEQEAALATCTPSTTA